MIINQTSNASSSISTYQVFCNTVNMPSISTSNNNSNNSTSIPKTVFTKSFLTSFHEKSLILEKAVWKRKKGLPYARLAPLIENLLGKADRSLTLGPYTVISKKKIPVNVTDKRFYFSFRPYLWPYDLLPLDLQVKVDAGELKLDPPCCLHRDGHRVPGSIIGGAGEENFDRGSAWYVVDNVTTLALAWFFSGM